MKNYFRTTIEYYYNILCSSYWLIHTLQASHLIYATTNVQNINLYPSRCMALFTPERHGSIAMEAGELLFINRTI